MLPPKLPPQGGSAIATVKTRGRANANVRHEKASLAGWPTCTPMRLLLALDGHTDARMRSIILVGRCFHEVTVIAVGRCRNAGNGEGSRVVNVASACRAVDRNS